MTFYHISYDPKLKDVQYSEGTDWETIICPKYSGHQRAGNRIGLMKIDLKFGKTGDFLWTFLSECLIKNEIAVIFQTNNITGYELKKAAIATGNQIKDLWELVVVGQGGDASQDSGIYLKEHCNYCGLKRYSAFEKGILVAKKNWDGSDIFTINGYQRYILVTEKVKELIEKNRFSGIKITPSDKLKWPNLPKP